MPEARSPQAAPPPTLDQIMQALANIQRRTDAQIESLDRKAEDTYQIARQVGASLDDLAEAQAATGATLADQADTLAELTAAAATQSATLAAMDEKIDGLLIEVMDQRDA